MELRHVAVRAGRLSGFLREELGMSAGLMNKLKWSGLIFVNGVPRRADFQVSPGDVITACLDEPEPDYPPETGPLTILYEDEHILAVDKPAGMLVHPSRSRNTGTLANLVAGYFRETGQNSAFHPVTRLDRDTFGLVLLAKNAYVHAILGGMHSRGELAKSYHALVVGGPRENAGTINAPIARRPLPSLLREIRPDGKEAVTEYRVLERGDTLCKLELWPVTGRTHQLRLHCAYMGFPIAGDPQYNDAHSLEVSRELGLESQVLCAKSLIFSHPVTGAPVALHSGMDACLPMQPGEPDGQPQGQDGQQQRQ